MTDNQFNELFGLVTKAVGKLTVVEEKIENLEKGQNELRQEFHEFREETRSNFEKISKEIGNEHRKISYLANQFLEIKAENEDLKERVTALEEKSAA